jgi:hypothetical protein
VAVEHLLDQDPRRGTCPHLAPRTSHLVPCPLVPSFVSRRRFSQPKLSPGIVTRQPPLPDRTKR